ncbi:hypothetical protein PPTG_20267 [Phytophthora nicotianae INRA-310]|uniref:Uncharacterized protein n=1 Tax=Phytophthora nicotianae (strain INRA-310) TaxID=761204 RepID=W2PBI1_PHYN3|nr:hypothetical protein PPTG_20267 [Phytophthora nicotianae INRA-310]ETM97334.1 hypothetical protein PPTG_20267 [Phytophthora nicotianae INRA-310]
MGSKRSCADVEDENEAKRAKTTEPATYEVRLGEEIYVNVDFLYNFPTYKTYFAKQYGRSVASFIKKGNLQVVCVAKKDVDNGKLAVKPLYAPKSDVHLAKKNDRIAELINLAKTKSYPLAPPVITDDDLAFFVDKSGERYEVEMRGKRTMEGIYFRVRDVGIVFGSPGCQKSSSEIGVHTLPLWTTSLCKFTPPVGISRVPISLFKNISRRVTSH